MKNRIRILALFLLVVMLLPLASACGDDGEVTRLSFKDAASYEDLKPLNGKRVEIRGYVATSSPVDGSSIFLMNLPYQSCPFCVPNTNQLSNTMKVYPQKNQKFSYTTQAIKVVGKLLVASSEKTPFTDEYNYEFSFKIVDATYTILKDEDLSAEMALWQKVAQSDIVTDLYEMYDYLNFVCNWPSYMIQPYKDSQGNLIPAKYVDPVYAKTALKVDGAQFNYGYKAGYFDALIVVIKAIDETAFADLVRNIEKAKMLAAKALQELESGNYTSEQKYSEELGATVTVYKLNAEAVLQQELEAVYTEFSNWISSWEL